MTANPQSQHLDIPPSLRAPMCIPLRLPMPINIHIRPNLYPLIHPHIFQRDIGSTDMRPILRRSIC